MVKPDLAGKLNILWPLGLVVILTFLVYYKTLNFEFTNWDDQKYVTENTLIKDLSFEGIKKIFSTPVAANYHPLTILSLALNYAVSDLDPYSYRLVNLLLHVLCSMLVFYFIYQVTRGKIEIAFITSLLFGIHPMHVESVAWMAARKDVLYTLFYLAGLITYIRYIQSRKLQWIGVTLLLFLLSVLSKPAAIVFPFVLLLLDYIMKRKWDVNCVLEKIPFLAISLIFGIITLNSQSTAGATGEQEILTSVQKVLFASYNLLIYPVKLIFPFNQSSFIPFPDTNSLPFIYYISPLILLGVSLIIFFFLRKNRTVVFGLLFFLINIAMVIQLIPFGNAIIAERYTYVPYIGLFYILGVGFSKVIKPEKQDLLKWKYPAIVLMGLFITLMMILSFKRTDVWKNSETLWTDVIKKYPEQKIGWYNLGHYYSETQQYEKSIPDFTKVIMLKPRDFESYFNRAQSYRFAGHIQNALDDYASAIAINPEEIQPYLCRGTAYAGLKDNVRSKEEFQKAIDLQPDNYRGWFGKGNADLYLRKFDQALMDYNKTIELFPGYADAWYNRALVYANVGDKKNGLENLQRAMELGHPPAPKLMNFFKE